MRAMILAAGRGQRLRPLSDKLPKPLARVGGKALIEYQLEALASSGIKETIINVCHLADMIKARLGRGERWGLDIHYSDESRALEWGGGIRQALEFFQGEAFLALSGDIWTDFPLSSLMLERPSHAHLVLVDNPDYHPRGDFGLDHGQVSYQHQPYYNYAGLGVFHPDIFKDQRPGIISFKQIMQPLIHKHQVSGQYHAGEWENIGTLTQLEALDLRLNTLSEI